MVVQTIVLEILGLFKSAHLRLAIEEDTNLKDLLVEHKPEWVRLLKPACFFYRNSKDDFTVGNIEVWLQNNRPDLWDVVEGSKQGKMWLRKQVKEIRELFFG